VLLEERVAAAEQRLGELPDDTGAAEARERIVALQRRDDRAVRKGLARPVVVGDDDLEAERLRALDLLDRGDAAVDGQHELDALVGEPLERVPVQAVALVEAAR
jgi:alkanesulfonate monooxygenase SsuD/methylene tetrahydromethanopterin reductase-like flavin-dependent oxidoreductase (luciferase family)